MHTQLSAVSACYTITGNFSNVSIGGLFRGIQDFFAVNESKKPKRKKKHKIKLLMKGERDLDF